MSPDEEPSIRPADRTVVYDEFLVDRLLRRYPIVIDTGRIELILELFHADARFAIEEVPGADVSGATAIAELFARFRRRRSPLGDFRLRHHATGASIELDHDHATAKSYFLVVSAQGIDHWGVYRDIITRVDGVWKFAERLVQVEGADEAGWWATSELPPPTPLP